MPSVLRPTRSPARKDRASFALTVPLRDWAGVRVPAVANGRVVVNKDAFLTAPSPRVTEALAVLAEVIAGAPSAVTPAPPPPSDAGRDTHGP